MFQAIAQKEISAGIQINHTLSMYTENGITLDVREGKAATNKWEVGFFLYSSVLGTAFSSNALRQMHTGISASRYFRKEKKWRPYVRLGMAYFVSEKTDALFDALPRTDTYVYPEGGLRYGFENLPLTIQSGVGYRVQFKPENQSPGTLQPLFYHLTLTYVVFKK